VTPDPQSDRYDPLPSVVELPRFLVRKIPPRARRPAAVAAALLLAAAIVGLLLGGPEIDRAKRERAAAEQRAAQELEARLIAQLKAEQRLRTGRGTPARGLEGAAALTARRALAADVAAAVKTDAVARVRSGEFTQSVDRVECERFPRSVDAPEPADDLASRTGRYSCLAITADAPRIETNEPSSLGYPYRARVDFRSGRFTFCKISGRPGEGSLTRETKVLVPAACGGTAR
jgi:hypothetical protein